MDEDMRISMKHMALAAAMAAARPATANIGYETYAKLYDRLSAGATAQALEDELLALAGETVTIPTAAKLKPKVKAAGFVEQKVEWKAPDGKTEKASVFTHLV